MGSGNFAGCSEGHVSIFKMFYVFLLFIFGQNSLGFRINENEQIIATAAIQNFHIETQVRSCGCEEKSALEELKLLKWTPQDFMTHHGKLWLGGVEAQNARNCSKLCPLVNKRTTHFTFEEQGSLCQCFSDLHPFHCEEEEGVNLVEIQCIDHLKVANSRPMLSVLSRLAGKRPSLRPKTSTIRPKEANFKLGSIEKSTQIAAA